MFDCELREGRSALVPTLRSGKGDSTGEIMEGSSEETSDEKEMAHPPSRLLPEKKSEERKARWCEIKCEDEEFVWWNGIGYPVALEKDGTVSHGTPDAYTKPHTVLLHLFLDPGLYSPCARARPPLPESEPSEDTCLETRGWWKGVGTEAPAVYMVGGGVGALEVGTSTPAGQGVFHRLRIVEVHEGEDCDHDAETRQPCRVRWRSSVPNTVEQ